MTPSSSLLGLNEEYNDRAKNNDVVPPSESCVLSPRFTETRPTINLTWDCVNENGGIRVTDAGYNKFCLESAASVHINLTYSKLHRRMETFDNDQSFQEIAKAGFYKTDEAFECFCCQLNPRMEAFTESTNPMRIHTLWSPHCPFVKGLANEDVRIAVQEEINTMEQTVTGIHPWRRTTLHTDDVIEALENGYEDSEIQTAVIRYFMRTGEYPNVENLRKEINSTDGFLGMELA
ncbi:uncharacterized protein LOC117327383 [Pecten maximus]|uniref:uncharacterized protein LOC117327383 n=1 Tax=Pecten maximus TaxID=6579 RepID=UPI001458410E|nr:uncharacterized protein LOC117327383 [Pecten maximus]XP_033740225.1 uncharacterized protein LOC117327383 [Pecten maximus]